MKVTFTIVSKLDPQTKEPKPLVKEFAIDSNGKLTKNANNAFLDYGVARTVITDFSNLPAILNTLQSNQALIHGVCKKFGDGEYEICSQRLQRQFPNAVTRTLDNFQWADPAIIMFDYDVPKNRNPLTKNELITAIKSLHQEFMNVPMVWKPSSTSNIIGDDGTAHKGLANQRIYVPVMHSLSMPAFIRELTYTAWEANFGYITISRSGTALPRTIFDTSVFSPERLDFAAAPLCKCGLRQTNNQAVFFDGMQYVNLSTMPINRGALLYKQMVAELTTQHSDEIAKIKAAYIDEETNKLIANGVQSSEAKNIVISRQKCKLSARDILYTNSMHQFRAMDIVFNPDTYNGMAIRDPLEPEYGTSKAKIFIDDNVIIINSFAHGGRVFEVLLGGDDFVEYLKSFSTVDVPNIWKTNLAYMEHSAIAVETAAKYISGVIGVSKNTVVQEIKAVFRTRKKESAASPEDMLDPTHHQMGAAIARLYGDNLIGYSGNFYQFDSLCWCTISSNIIENAIIEQFDGVSKCSRNSDYSAIQKHIYSMVVDEEFFTMVKPMLATLDGVWEFDKENSKTTCYPHSKLLRSRFILPVSVHEVTSEYSGQIPPMFGRYMEDTFAGTEYQINLAQEIMGAILFGVLTTDWHKAVMLRGAGNNGKSVFIDILSGLIPKRYVSNISPFQFDNPVFLAELAGKMLNVVSEIEQGKRIPGAAFKTVVDSAVLTGKRLYQAPFQFDSTAAQVFSGNYDIITTDQSDGMKRRWIILSFDNSVSAENRIPQLGKVIAAREAGAIIAWAMAGVERLYKQGGFSTGVVNERRHASMFFQTDTVKQFMGDTDIVTVYTESIKNHAMRATRVELYKKYREWCQINGFTAALKKFEFNNELEKLGLRPLKSNGQVYWDRVSVTK